MVTKPYEFTWFGAMDGTKPYEFIGIGAMDVTKPSEFIGFGAMDFGIPFNMWSRSILQGSSLSPDFPEGGCPR